MQYINYQLFILYNGGRAHVNVFLLSGLQPRAYFAAKFTSLPGT